MDRFRNAPYDSFDEPYAEPARGGFAPLFSPWDWGELHRDVAQECRARITLVGAIGVGKSSIHNALRGWEASPVSGGHDGAARPRCEDFGLFVLVDLPVAPGAPSVASDLPLGDAFPARMGDGAWEGQHEPRPGWPEDGLAEPSHYGRGGADDLHAGSAWGWVEASQLIVFVLDASQPFGAAEYRWFSRLRSLGGPTVTVANKIDQVAVGADECRLELERRLACRVVPICALDERATAARLLPRLVDAWPDVAVPLGREVPAARRLAADRVIRRTALTSTAFGLEPIPLLDLPIHLAVQMKMLMRLSVLYGQPAAADGSREVLASVAGGLALRYSVQQAAKLLPVQGWIMSSLLSGLTTVTLGRAAVARFEGRAGRAGAVPSLRTHLRSALARVRHPRRWRLPVPAALARLKLPMRSRIRRLRPRRPARRWDWLPGRRTAARRRQPRGDRPPRRPRRMIR